jgi:sterol desaturase/sphingolipid hydroxylase (fatty acid hydroxylase superfamily)
MSLFYLHRRSELITKPHRVGFLDGDKHGRDPVPDVGVDKVLLSVELTTTIRPIFTIFLAYNSSAPVALSPWLPFELFLYSIVLDFFFYAYHRACHEIDGLWQYHRTHHLTKHPNPLLSAYSDSEQEIIEIALVPLLTYGVLKMFGFPMGFYDWWVCHQYLIFSEAFGHSGLRICSSTPGISSIFLKMVDCELVVEDHDLHHRQGWRTSCNYGKQTRLWDRIFGTCGKRIEAKEENVDYANAIDMPLY